METKDYYKTLGISETASQDEIKKAYRSLAKQYHPDREHGDESKMSEINEAYNTLSDSASRERYDHMRRNPRHYNNDGNHFYWRTDGNGGFDFGDDGGGVNDLHDFIRTHFGFGARRGQYQQRPPQNRTVRLAMQVPLAETLAEQSKTLKISFGGKEELITIKIPRGIRSQSVRYPHIGDRTHKDQPAGDVIVDFTVTIPDGYAVSGFDIHTEISVDCIHAMLGTKATVTNIDGTKFELDIPAGTQNNTKFGIPDKGLYHTGTEFRGRLVIAVNIVIPKNLSSEQVELLKKLQETLNHKEPV